MFLKVRRLAEGGDRKLRIRAMNKQRAEKKKEEPKKKDLLDVKSSQFVFVMLNIRIKCD